MSKLAKALTAAAGNAGGESVYVEDVFSTYVYQGSNAARTIDNGIALSDEGGLVWLKQRGAVDSHILFDTVNGPQKSLSSNSTAAGADYSSYFSFPSAGTEGWNLSGAVANGTGTTWASWTFRKQAGFFDIQTWTGNGTNRTISHDLGCVPGFIIVKRTSNAEDWTCYHVGVPGNANYIQLNKNDAYASNSQIFQNTAPTSSVFSIGEHDRVNTSGETYVAYLFAGTGDSDSQIFGDGSDEAIIKCGSFTEPSSGSVSINLGFEPQFVLAKPSSTSGDWYLFDIMRGMPVSPATARLSANSNSAEVVATSASGPWPLPTATGFDWKSGFVGNETWIYIAIRRPMKTPESGTEVFSALNNQPPADDFIDHPILLDMVINKHTSFAQSAYLGTRLLGTNHLLTASTAAETYTNVAWDYQTGYEASGFGTGAYVSWGFKRATGFFDVVAYTGDGASSQTIQHNLGATPELIIGKSRSGSGDWPVYYGSGLYNVFVNLTQQQTGNGTYFETGATYSTITSSTQFNVALLTGGNAAKSMNTAGVSYILYIFATLAGISKVGSYTGTAADLDVDCGFTAGARFILIKRTDSTGDWYVYDSERGIVAGNDPYLLLNSTAAEVTSTDYIDPLSSGFTVTSSAPAGLNASGGSYIFLAIS